MSTEGMRIVNEQAEQSHRAVERQEARDRMTDEMREYLRTLPEGILFTDVVTGMMQRFSLSGTDAGRVLGQWITEVAAGSSARR